MTLLIDQSGIEQISGIISRRLGLQFDNGRRAFLVDALRQRMSTTRCESVGAYAELLTTSPNRVDEFRVLAEQLTVVETFFFRNADNFRAFSEHVLPERLRVNVGIKRLRILSAGCASGEEPYSLAMTLRETMADLASWDVRIDAVDVNPSMLKRAANARYSSWALRATSDAVRNRYFRPDGREFVLDPEICKMVTFHERNLVDKDPSFWRSSTYDVVFCRNVLMYFAPEVMRQVVGRVGSSLLPDGFLFLGHAETLRGMSQEFHLRHTHDTFYYQRRGKSGASIEWDDASPPALDEVATSHPSVVEPMVPWFDVIQRASARIASLPTTSMETRPGVESDASASEGSTTHAPDFALVLDAMRQERFADALNVLSDLPADALEEPDALLLRAALLTNCGRLDEAEETCHRLIVLDELNAGAHYLTALCREHAGDVSGAMEHNQSAIYLDAGFAMPHLHLGLIAKRGGDAVAARRGLAQALALLAHEDSSRLLLFGGGFSREALMQVCRAGLAALGGP